MLKEILNKLFPSVISGVIVGFIFVFFLGGRADEKVKIVHIHTLKYKNITVKKNGELNLNTVLEAVKKRKEENEQRKNNKKKRKLRRNKND